MAKPREDAKNLALPQGVLLALIQLGKFSLLNATFFGCLASVAQKCRSPLSFASQEGTNSFRPTPPEIQSPWEEINLAAMGMGQPKATAAIYATGCSEWSESQVNRLNRDTFQCA